MAWIRGRPDRQIGSIALVLVALASGAGAAELPTEVFARPSGNALGEVRDPANRWLRADLAGIRVIDRSGPLPSPESELATVAAFLATVPAAEAHYLRFFTFYAVPDEAEFTVGIGGKDVSIGLRQAALLSLSFVLNSTAHVQRSQGAIVSPAMVPGSRTIAYINIEDYGWTEGQWERISKIDPYLSGALLHQADLTAGYGYAGNALFRGDWFLVAATDAQRQADAKIAELVYYTLLYDDQIPPDGAAFRKILGVDAQAAIANNLDRRAVIEAGRSGVSIATGGNRKIQGIRTPTGYYWETFDTRAADFLNNLELDDKVKDAGELIASHKNGLQVYLLVNQDDRRVEFADNGLVEDSHPLNRGLRRPVDRRVKTAIGCMTCHAVGLNPVPNSIVESLREGVELNVLVQPSAGAYLDYQAFRAARARYLRLDRRYVNNGIEAAIEADNKLYEQAVRQCNGLDPTQNAYLLWSVCDWYDRGVTLRQAAVEMGLSPARYVEETRGTISARVSRIVASDKFAIPRKYWDALEPPGDYAQSVLTIRLHAPAEVRKVLAARPSVVASPAKLSVPATLQARVATPIKVTTEDGREIVLGTLAAGQSLPYSSFDGTWYQIVHDGQIGFVLGRDCTAGPLP